MNCFSFSNPGHTALTTAYPVGYAVAFPNTLVTQGSKLLSSDYSFTFETWLYINGFVNPAGGYSGCDSYQTIFLASGSAGYTLFFRTFKSGTMGYLTVYNYTGNGNPTTSSIMPVGAWTHVRVTYSGSTLVMRIDVNNVSSASMTLAGAISPLTFMALGTIDSARSSSPLNGMMDETRLWPYVRTDAQNLASWTKHNLQLTDIKTAAAAWSYQYQNPDAYLPGGYADDSGNGRGVAATTNSYENVQVISTVPFN